MYHNISDIHIKINQVYSLKNSVVKHIFLNFKHVQFYITLQCCLQTSAVTKMADRLDLICRNLSALR